jgi:hypothetical protein
LPLADIRHEGFDQGFVPVSNSIERVLTWPIAKQWIMVPGSKEAVNLASANMGSHARQHND